MTHGPISCNSGPSWFSFLGSEGGAARSCLRPLPAKEGAAKGWAPGGGRCGRASGTQLSRIDQAAQTDNSRQCDIAKGDDSRS